MSLLDALRPVTGTLRGNGKVSAAVRRWRRAKIARSFTRFLARKPMGDAAVGELGASWRTGLESWRAGWAAKRANSPTVRLGRNAAKRLGR